MFRKRKKMKFDESMVSFINDPDGILKEVYFSNFMDMTLNLKFKVGDHEFDRKINGKTIEEVLIEGNKIYKKIGKAGKIIKEELDKIK